MHTDDTDLRTDNGKDKYRPFDSGAYGKAASGEISPLGKCWVSVRINIISAYRAFFEDSS